MTITSNERFCPICGTRLTTKEQPEDGMVPWCPSCREYRYPTFNVAVSVIVRHPSKPQILTIDQYGKEGILVAGYVTRGEAAEQTVAREVHEECGLDVEDITFNASSFFEPSNTLMLNFSCRALERAGELNAREVDAAHWIAEDDILDAMLPDSLARRFVAIWLTRGHDTDADVVMASAPQEEACDGCE